MNVNYWNMKNYMPLFSCDSKEFERLHKDIGNKAATQIHTNFRKYLKRNSPNGLYGKKTVTRPRSPGLRWGERN